MSRVGKHPVNIPSDVAVVLSDQTLTAKGRLGTLRLVVSNEVAKGLSGITLARMKMKARLVVLYGEFGRLFRATGQIRFDRENDCAAAIPHVPFGSLGVVRRRSLDQWIYSADWSVFSPSPFRAPAAAFNAPP